MNSHIAKLSRAYDRLLQRFLFERHERILQNAYELGRQAVAGGLGVLDIAKLHEEVLARLLLCEKRTGAAPGILSAAKSFLLEVLSPFEVTHRGFRQSNERMQQLIHKLEEQNETLAWVNRELEVEVKMRKRTENALRKSESNARELSNKILHVQEEERAHISRELHDEVGQALTAVNVNLALLKRNGSTSSRKWKRRIADTQGLLERTMETVHHFARELRPAMLEDLGLVPALRSYIKDFSNRTSIKVQLQAHSKSELLDTERKVVFYRIMQESLTNVAKHARATEVNLKLTFSKGEICMRVSDNGKAFKVHHNISSKRKKRLGIVGMQERVRLVNGRFGIISVPGRGTSVCVCIPLPAK